MTCLPKIRLCRVNLITSKRFEANTRDSEGCSRFYATALSIGVKDRWNATQKEDRVECSPYPVNSDIRLTSDCKYMLNPSIGHSTSVMGFNTIPLQKWKAQ